MEDASSPVGSGQFRLLDQLAEEFAARFRCGQRPSMEEYTDRYPELAEEIRELFPAMVVIERVEDDWVVKDEPGEMTGAPATPPWGKLGDFQIIREVGRGGMGIVFEAEQVSLGRRVALKVLPQHRKDGSAEVRFRREARAAARLHHTNIVPVFEVGQEGEVSYYAMQFIQGQGLDLVIDELRRLRDQSRDQHPGAAPPGSVGWLAPPVVARTPEGNAARRADDLSQMARSLLTGQFVVRRPFGADPQGSAASVPNQAPTVSATTGFDDRETRAGLTSRNEVPGSGGAPGSLIDRAAASPSSSASVILPGGTQLSMVDSGRRPFYLSIARIGRQAASALAHAHARGIIHRDIKPSNLLLDTDGTVWITDFGLAKGDEEGLTQTGDVLGTIRYMAPERFRGDADPRSDVYALGLTLYELLVQRPAFTSSDRLRLVELIKTEEPVRPRASDPRIPHDLETIVLKASAKDAKRRYATADELGEDLQRFINGEPIRARRVGELERIWMWAQRHRSMATLGIVLLVSLAAGTAFSTVFAIRAGDRAQAAAFAEQQARRNFEAAETARQQADEARQHAHDAALEARRLAARSTAAKALAAAEAGEVERGLLGLIDALEVAPDVSPEDRADRLALRRNLAAWHAALPVLRFAAENVSAAEFLKPDGTVLAYVTDGGRRLRRLDLVSGRPVGDPAGRTFPEPIVAIRPDGRIVATRETSGSTRESESFVVRLRDAETGAVGSVFPSAQGGLIRLRFATGSRHLIVTHRKVGHVTQTWRIEPPGSIGPVVSRYWRDEPERDDQIRVLIDRGGRAVAAVMPRDFDPSQRSQGLRFWDLDADRAVPGVALEPGSRGPGWVVDGRVLRTIKPVGRVEDWDPATGLRLASWRPNRAEQGARITADGRTLVVGGDDHRVRFYDLATHEECGPVGLMPTDDRTPSERSWEEQLQVSPGGMFCLARRARITRVWQVPGPLRSRVADAARRPTLFARPMIRPDARAAILATGFTSSFARVGYGLGLDSTVALQLDLETGRPLGRSLWPLGNHAAYSPDSRLLAAALVAQVGSWPRPLLGVVESETGRPVLPLIRTPQYVQSLAFSPDRRTLAAGQVAGTGLYDLRTGRLRAFLQRPGPAERVAFSPDSRWLAVVSYGGWDDHRPDVQVWDVASGRPSGSPVSVEPWQDHLGPHALIGFTKDSRALVIVDIKTATLWRWEAATGQVGPKRQFLPRPASTSSDETLWRPPSDASPSAFRHDGEAMIIAVQSNALRQYDTTSGGPLGSILIHPSPVTSVSYSQDGATLAAACSDGSVRLWDAATGMAIGPDRYHPAPVIDVAFTPDGSRLRVVMADATAASWPVLATVSNEAPAELRLWIEATCGLRRLTTGELDLTDLDSWRTAHGAAATMSSRLPSPLGVELTLEAWHRTALSDAEASGDGTAARWHLDRLSALRKDDWTLQARRALTFSDAGRPVEAGAAYDRAAQQAPATELAAWYAWRGHRELDLGRREVALWYLNRGVAALPHDWLPLVHRAFLLDKLGQGEAAQRDRDAAIERGPDPLYLVGLAEEAASHGQWPRAARLFETANEKGQVHWPDLVRFRLGQGDHAGYRQACSAALRAVGPKPVFFYQGLEVAWVCGLGPGGLDDYTSPLVLARDLVAKLERVTKPSAATRELLHDAVQCQAILLFRSGRPNEARERLRRAIAVTGQPNRHDLLFSALIDARLGRRVEAQSSLRQAAALDLTRDREAPWQTRIEAEVLRGEAEATIIWDPVFPKDAFAP